MDPLLSSTNGSALPSLLPTNSSLQPPLSFEAGSFKVGRSGQVEINYLSDGGSYEGEVGVFSLRGMGGLVSDLGRFVQEAVRRVLSRSTLGQIALSDRSEAAHMVSSLDGLPVNAGRYAGVKSFQFDPGDELAFLLMPNGTISDLQAEVQDGEITPDQMPLFSLGTANPNDAFHLRQIADVTGQGNTFAWEDWRTDCSSDRDYNDLIFQVRGATTTAPNLDQVINPNWDWRTTRTGIELINYLKINPIGSITRTLPDPVTSAIHAAMDLQTYDPQVLATVQHWVVGVLPGQSSIDLAVLIGAKSLQPTGHIPNTYIWEVPMGSDATEVMLRLEALTGVEFAYPIVPLPLELQNDPAPTPPNPVFVNPANGNRYFLTNPTTWAEAQAIAEKFGGNLVTVNNAAENEWLVNTFGTRDLWVGLTDSEIYGATEGKFRWISGEPVTYTNWYSGMPDNGMHTPGGDGEDVVHINFFAFVSPTPPGLWNDAPGDFELGIGGPRRDPGIVEIPNFVEIPNSLSLPNPVFVNPANGNRYFLTNRATWAEAQAVAEQFGGDLVTVNNTAEQQWLVNTFGINSLWVGLTDSELYGATEGNFRWISGEPVTYTNWYPGNPNNFNHRSGSSGEDFVHMNFLASPPTPPGLWNDMPIGYEIASQGPRRDPGIVEIPNSASWHLQMNQVTPVQNQVSGRGVTIGIVDSGLSYTHADLASRYRADLSRSFRNSIGQVYGTDPSPDVSSPFPLDQQSAAHGTAVAGIAAGAANAQGGAGVAPGANVIGLRLLDIP